MSQTAASASTFQYEEEKSGPLFDRAEQKQVERGNTILWHNPVTDMIYRGTGYMSYGPEPTWEEPVFDVKVARQQIGLYKAGKIKREDMENPWQGRWLRVAQEFGAIRKRAIREGKLRLAATGTNSDFSTINIVNVFTKVLGLEFPMRVLIESVLSVDTPSTLLSVDVGTPYQGHAQATETYFAEPERQKYVRSTFNLPKDIAIFGLTDEAQLKASHNLFQLHVENAPRVLRKLENKVMAAIIETATAVAKGDWSAVSSGLSSRDPFPDFEATFDTISGNGGDLSDFAIGSHNKVFTNFSGNTFVRGAYNRRLEDVSGTGRVTMIDRLIGGTWYIDNDLTNTKCTVWTRDAFVRANGPTFVAQWRDENRMTELYRAAHFCQTKLLQSGRAVCMTGVD